MYVFTELSYFVKWFSKQCLMAADFDLLVCFDFDLFAQSCSLRVGLVLSSGWLVCYFNFVEQSYRVRADFLFKVKVCL